MTPTKIASQLLQTSAEWDLRNATLSREMAALVDEFAPANARRGIDIGCQTGAIADALSRCTRIRSWVGVDPRLASARVSDGGCNLLPGTAAGIPFPDGHFEAALFANVYEHIVPEEREASLREMFRILSPAGVVVGQLPNPYFPIESHSRLPFMGWLPIGLQRAYWRVAPVSWEHDFYVVTIKHLLRTARVVGFEVVMKRNFNYPPEVIPRAVRWVAKGLERPTRRLPWAWQFVLRRPMH